MGKYFLYMHAGSFNRGCEAIVRSTCKILDVPKENITLFSGNPQEDIINKIGLLCDIRSYKEYKRYTLKHVLGALTRKISGSLYFYYQNLISNSNSEVIALSIGGDNYCYEGFPKVLAETNKMLKKRGARTVLWGCSIEPVLLKNNDIVEDLKRYNLITPRESITYNTLLEKEINKNTHLYPDPAFILDMINLPLPKGFRQNNTVGIYISPLVKRRKKTSYHRFIQFPKLL